MDPHYAKQYVILGQWLRDLRWTMGRNPVQVAGRIPVVLELLESLDFRHTLSAHGHKLKQCRETIWSKKDSLEFTHAKGIPEEYAKQLLEAVDTILDSVLTESGNRRLLILHRNTVGERLRSLKSTNWQDYQKVILQDTIRCLETGAYRAAMVMGWSLAYEHLRRWIFAKVREDFNRQLVQKYRNRNNTYDAISEYEDFFELGERLVIDICRRDAKLIGPDHYKVLVDSLNTRNRFAHPNFSQATPDMAKGYIDQLILNIIDHPHFAF